jgi:hypothetical protein
MRLSPRASLLEKLFDIDVELVAIDSPHAATAELDSWQFPRAHKCVDLRTADVEVASGLLEGKKARVNLDFVLLGARSLVLACHTPIMGQKSYVC